MTNNDYLSIIDKVSQGIIEASTTISDDRKRALDRFHEAETQLAAKQVLADTIENFNVAKKLSCATCDDTGIPHLLLEVGRSRSITGEFLNAIRDGVAEGLRKLPGRPMAVKGDDIERVEQSLGLYDDPGMLIHAPILIKSVDNDKVHLKILMQGGGPEIRSKTFRVFHKRSMRVVLNEVLTWAKDEVSKLGCTPCSPMIGIGRTHFEATSMMLEAMVNANYDVQTEYETYFTDELNKSNVGPLGLGGSTTAIGTFIKVGPQRSSGIRVVCLRLACSVEPRYSSIEL